MHDGQMSGKVLEFGSWILNTGEGALCANIAIPTSVFLVSSYKCPIPLKLKWLGIIKQIHERTMAEKVFLTHLDICYVKLSTECYRPDYVVHLIKPLRSSSSSAQAVHEDYGGYLRAAAQSFLL